MAGCPRKGFRAGDAATTPAGDFCPSHGSTSHDSTSHGSTSHGSGIPGNKQRTQGGPEHAGFQQSVPCGGGCDPGL